MITRDLWQIMSPETGKFVHTDYRSPGFAAATPQPGTWLVLYEEDPIKGDMQTRAQAEQMLVDEKYPMQRDRLQIVPAPTCGCCGYTDCPWSERQLKLVKYAPHPVGQIWRCEKHVGRLPCCIEGCGRTFKIEAGESYHITTMCSRHWRQAPRCMRDAVARVRKLARRYGWTEHLLARHHRLWHRCARAVREGQNLDMREIERMFGL